MNSYQDPQRTKPSPLAQRASYPAQLTEGSQDPFPTEHLGDVGSQVQSLTEDLHQLQGVTGTLIKRLQPIVRFLPKDRIPGKEEEKLCPLANQMRCISHELKMVINDLNDISESIQL